MNKTDKKAEPDLDRSSSAARFPLRFGDDPLLWASWLYYEEGMTQGDVAAAMNVSRPTVNSYLAEARSSGIVNITISAERLKLLSLAQQLQDHFSLSECLVIPGEGGERPLIQRLGSAGAQVLGRLIRSGDLVGITWGRTMLAVANATQNLNLKDVRVVQATGGTTAMINFTPEACARRLAEALGAQSIPISAPGIVSSPDIKRILLNEPIVESQIAMLDQLDCIVCGVSSLRVNSTIYASGFFDVGVEKIDGHERAVGSIAGRLIDADGKQVEGALADRTVGIDLDQIRNVERRIVVAGGFDKVPAIVASLRGQLANVLVTDAATGEGILRADGADIVPPRSARKLTPSPENTIATRSKIKKFINQPGNAVIESVEGALLAFPQFISPIGTNRRAIRSTTPAQPGQVGIVIGGGAGHEPCFLGFVGPGLADVVAIGNVFASPPPDRVLTCTRAASSGGGVLYIYGNYTGDVMNFDMAAEMAHDEGIDVRTVLTTDDIASSLAEDRERRRGTAGGIFVFKIAGAASRRMYSLDECERLARKANAATFTMGVGLEPCSLPETQRPSFRLGENDMEVGVGIHGEPGVVRHAIETADGAADRMFDSLAADMQLSPGDRIVMLVNSLGGTPMMELLILNRRMQQRLAARGVTVMHSLVGPYCTSLDMVGASVSMMKLDQELADLYDDGCSSFAWVHHR